MEKRYSYSHYIVNLCGVAGLNISSSTSEAISLSVYIACAYIDVVVPVLLCPARFETVGIGMPAAISSVIFVCRLW